MVKDIVMKWSQAIQKQAFDLAMGPSSVEGAARG